eukprot:g1492.t1
MNSCSRRGLFEVRNNGQWGLKERRCGSHRQIRFFTRKVFLEGSENAKKRELDISSGTKTEFVAETLLPTRKGLYRLRGYRHTVDDWKSVMEPTAIIVGDIERSQSVPVRVHDSCFTSEVLGSLKCDCADQLEMSLDYIREHPPGMVIYLQQEGRGIGLANKIAAYRLQESGLDTVDANRALGLPDDCREYSSVLYILNDLEISSIRLITNNPRKIESLKKYGVKIDDRIPCLVQPGAYNHGYLKTKEQRMDHLLDGSWCYWNHEGDPGLPSMEATSFTELRSDIDSTNNET